MRTTGKRMLSILLCLCMAACMLPTVAFAADTGKAIQLGTDALSKEEAVTVERVQAMIDALPGAEEITEDNTEEVKAQLEAIDEAKAQLSDEELDQLDFSLYTEAASALGGLAKPMLTASTKKISVRMKVNNGNYKDSVSGGAPTAYGTTHTLTVTPNTGRYVIAGYFAGTDYIKKNPSKYEYKSMTLNKIKADASTGAVTYQFTATEGIPIENDNEYDYIYLYFHCAKLPTLQWVLENVSGEATAPSVDGKTAAKPYISKEELCGDPNEYTGYYRLADKTDRPYLDWQVISITDKEGNSAGGTVAFDNNHLTYTPTADEAGKTVTITIRPKLGYVEEANTPLSFEIKVKKPVVEQSEFYVTMVTDGYGNAVARPNSAKEGEEIQLTAIPDRGHHFKEWQATSGNIMITNDKFTMPAGNVTVKAIFEANTYTVKLDANGGTIASGQDVTSYTYGVGATLPTAGDMDYTGHTFKGWYDNEGLTGDPVTAIGGTETGNKAYWAKWTINQYTITFDTAGGSEIAPITQDYGTTITAPEAPTKSGYTFMGWSPALPATMPAENLTLTAQWTVNQYTITYDLAGGTAEGNLDTYTIETGAFTLKNPTKSGYTFTGWSGTGLDGENNMTVTIPTGSTGNRTYKAHWRYNGSGHSYSYYTIKATAGTGGSISPAGSVSVREGRDQTFTITPDKDYAVSNVKIDGKSIGAVKSYTFENVRRTHTIEVSFMKANGNPQTGVFVDVATGSYYENAVDWAVENGITKGTDDIHFSPGGICTRAQAVTFLWRAAGSPEPETRTMPFTDVPAGSYYYDAVLWAVENGITEGTSDTTFSPNAICTRAQIVTFLWRSEKSPAAGTANPFADVKSTAYYAGAVLWAVKEDITKGTTSTTFSPNADCTRAQIVTFLWRCKK